MLVYQTSMKNRTIFAVINAGGKGERLWPLSNAKVPKPFLRFGDSSLLQDTIARIVPLVPEENIYVVTTRDFAHLVLEQLPTLPRENIIPEPMGRGTAPCIGLAAIILERVDPEGVMIAHHADLVIKEVALFQNILDEAIGVAALGEHLITIGIVPSFPATGFGYIHRGGLFMEGENVKVYRVEGFTEKPDEASAKEFLKEGDYFWNSGIFIWRVDRILTELEEHLPRLYQGLMEIKAHLGEPGREEILERVYRDQQSISIDHGVLERSSRVLVIPADIGWRDIGDWAALEMIFEKDEDGNIVQAEHLGLDTKDSIIFSSDRRKLIVTIGLSDVVIVDTGEKLLVMEKGRAQEVREIARQIGE